MLCNVLVEILRQSASETHQIYFNLGAMRKEREALIRNRKAELKRVDHTARALREEEVELLKDWKVRMRNYLHRCISYLMKQFVL